MLATVCSSFPSSFNKVLKAHVRKPIPRSTGGFRVERLRVEINAKQEQRK
jgi:hypothetical protein